MENVIISISEIANSLSENNLRNWTSNYAIENDSKKTIGVIMAGNLPLVGFHDEPQCAAVCPVDCCVDDEDRQESEEELEAKKEKMHE